MISFIDFFLKFLEFFLVFYIKNFIVFYDLDGIVQVWNMYFYDCFEFVFYVQFDIFIVKFLFFYLNLIIGGVYSGQVFLWDMCVRLVFVQKILFIGFGYIYLVYLVDIVGI